jgi:DNA-binding winged helix-turn-helix (wHTH) protein/tetratricopeptide (TPR) repeat protein
VTRFRFGSFELDPVTGELFGAEGPKGDARIILREQPLQVLRMLLDRGGVIVTRDEIKARLWPNDTIVDFDHSINVAIGVLRRAVGDSAASPRYIETVARRGYRLLVAVERADVVMPAPQGMAAERAKEAPAQPLTPPPSPVAAGAGLVGKKVARYRVLDLIGGGGMGMVYRAEDLKLGRRVALKFLPEELAADSAALRLLEREARTSSALNHPNICTIYDVDEYEGQPFIAMELLEGETLLERMRQTGGRMPVDETLQITMDVCDGLQAAHEQNIIHRDIKPANLFLTKQGAVKILDFGVAKLVADPDAGPGEAAAGSDPAASGAQDTSSRSLVASGTPSYMSPEQVRREPLDQRTDLFSLGLVLYEMAAGERAFAGDTRAAIHEAIVHAPLVPAQDRNPSVPRELDGAIGKALEKDRGRRYGSAAEMRAALQEVERRRRPGRRRLRAWLAAAAALAVVAAGVWLYRDYRQRVTLAETDTIVLADVRNQTGDPAFDDALTATARIGLDQTPYLSVLAPDKVFGTLAALQLPTTTKLTPDVARRVALRTNSRIVIAPSIADAGNGFRIALVAMEASSGAAIARVGEDASNREGVVHSLGIAESKLRKQLGEPSASLARFDRPLDEATSASPEALQQSFTAYKLYLASDWAGAASAWRRAIELDPRFAIVYAALGSTYERQGNVPAMGEACRKAFELRERMTEPYRQLAEYVYYDLVTGEEEKACDAVSRWVQSYSRDVLARASLGRCQGALGRPDRAADELRETARLSPSASTYLNKALAAIHAGELGEARATLKEADARHFVIDDTVYCRVLLAFLERDEPAIRQFRIQAEQKPGQFDLLYQLSQIDWTYGRRRAARALAHRATEEAARGGGTTNYDFELALWETEFGDVRHALDTVAKVPTEGFNKRDRIHLAMTYARAGETRKAAEIADQLAADFPLATIFQKYAIPAIRAAVRLDEKDAAAAVEILKPALPYDLSNLVAFDALYPAYIRGLAYLELRQAGPAAAEFQKVLDHPGLVGRGPLMPLARLQLARTLLVQGDRAGARRSYEQLLADWKNADPDLPVLQQAKAEYAKLLRGSSAAP